MNRDDEALGHLRMRVDTANRGRDSSHQAEVQAIVRQAASKHMLLSGNTIAQLTQQALEDIRIRATLFLQSLEDTWRSFRPGLAAIPPAQQMLSKALHSAAEARERDLQQGTAAQSMGGMPASVWDRFRSDWEREAKYLDLKLSEWAQLQSQAPAVQTYSQTTTVSFTGDNNVVTAGLINSAANIQLDSGAIQRLLEALAAVRSAVERTGSLPPLDTTETLELVSDAERELQREQPNKKKLRATLEGIATTIQTVGALSEAYGVLKNAMALVGISLP